ncbi:MAG: SLBB domain-containing protein [Bacteroidota bacterium]|nr:SLBB domain-containing protein [Bacteroidota bacterium]
MRRVQVREDAAGFCASGGRKPLRGAKFFAIATFSLLSWAHGLWAQMPTGAGLATDPLRSNVGAYYYMARPGDLTVIVSIWGEVRNPGQYEVPAATDLVQLLSYAGGPLVTANLRRVRLIRRSAPGERPETVQIVDVVRLIAHPADTPRLQPGDVIVLERRAGVRFTQEILPVLRDVAFFVSYMLVALRTVGVL